MRVKGKLRVLGHAGFISPSTRGVTREESQYVTHRVAQYTYTIVRLRSRRYSIRIDVHGASLIRQIDLRAHALLARSYFVVYNTAGRFTMAIGFN
jgi:hypothetical protein